MMGNTDAHNLQSTLWLARVSPYKLSICIAVWVTLASYAHAQGQNTELPPITYEAAQQTYELMLDTDAVGIVLREENIDQQAIAGIIPDLNAELQRAYRGGLVVLRLGRRATRAELFRIAARLAESEPNLIAMAGIVLRPFPGADPVLAGNELIVQLRDGRAREDLLDLNEEANAEFVMENPFRSDQFLLRVSPGTDVIEVAERYRQLPAVEEAYPNFINVFYDTETLLNDTFFGNQWHHRNTGQGGGTLDADADTSWAWDITQGNASTVVSVLENGGFDMTHPDLTPNFWSNPGEIPANGVDDDGNTFVDDINGWDFVGCTPVTSPGCGDNNPAPAGNEDHGTAVAGVAAARGGNGLGVAGSCPNCALMVLRTGYTASDFAKSLAFGYAQQMGSRIVTNSWGGGGAMPNTVAAINAAAAAGVVVLFAAGNTTADVCAGPSPDPRVSLNGVIAVSSSTNQERKVIVSAIGNCIDVLAPSHRGYNATDPYTGTLNVTTTDRQTVAAGYNSNNPVVNCPQAEPAPPPATDGDYTNCFGGTSSATPLTAGVVGLILTVNNGLTRLQVQNLLQDTADRIEDSVGSYSAVNGFSTPAVGNATHANGRINAFEAVRVVAPVAQGGKAGVDIFLRDNRLDWGNTEQPSNRQFEATPGFIGHWRSMDIKVDAPPYAPSAPSAATFDAFVDETPSAIAGDVNRVYVRVRNRGPNSAATVRVKLHWTQFSAGLPALPTDFWTAFPGDPAGGPWTPLDCAVGGSTVCTASNLVYSGASVAGTLADAAQVVRFDFPAPPVDPTLDNHFCLLAMVDSDQDPIDPSSATNFVVDAITPTDNNVTHRNYHNLPTGSGDSFLRSFLLHNPFPSELTTRLRIETLGGWKATLIDYRVGEPVVLAPGEDRTVQIYLQGTNLESEGEVTVMQETLDPPAILGGLTFRYRPSTEPVVENDGSESSYLVGAWASQRNDSASVRIVNPTGRYVEAVAAFFDDAELPLRCVRERLSPNDLWEIDVARLSLQSRTGVVKILALVPGTTRPSHGIVGSVRQTRRGRSLSESLLHPIGTRSLQSDIDVLRRACDLQ